MTSNLEGDPASGPEQIAIIGMAGRFPGARTVGELWRNLCAGVESIRAFSDDELVAAGTPAAELAAPGVVKAGAVLDDVDAFDAEFFGVSRREAEILDPQQRHFLECAWEALESAGCIPSRFRGPIGVFAGASPNTYLLSNLITRRDLIAQLGRYQILVASDKDYLATRVSYKLNLTGPSMSVQTACSTSLVAVHLACQSLLNGECDVALAGGASISVPHVAPYVFQDGGILSPDGHCRAFDADARGMVPGNGVGVVVLKRLGDAIADRDPIVAVIKGSAVNNDGAAKAGFTAPGLRGQTRALREALGVANVAAGTVGFIECHGTGTALGDPNELEALAAAYRDGDATTACWLGSLKTNLGHLDAAAGVTGLIKAALCVAHGVVPPTLHFRTPTPRFDFARSRFRVAAQLERWTPGDGPRRAAVSSFGIGGTNAHAIVEQPPPVAPRAPSDLPQVLAVSARTPAALARALDQLATALAAEPAPALADVAYTLQTGREPFAYRRAIVAPSHAAAIALLREAAGAAASAAAPGVEPEIVFLFPGQGSQYVAMAQTLERDAPVFRAELDACAAELARHLGGEDLRDLLWPRDPGAIARAERLLDQTRYTQPALFAIEYALARQWMAWGVTPSVVTGHSVGEYVAACLAGVFSLPDALAVIAARGRLIQAMPAGAILAVFASEAALAPTLPAGVTIAAVNGPGQCVVAGARDDIAALEAALRARGTACRALRTSHAFHSPAMDPVLPAFAAELSRVALHPPRLRCLSNVTGTWLTAADATDPRYWVRHLREAVRFGDGLATLRDPTPRVLLEVGPGRALGRLGRRVFDSAAAPAIIASLPDAGEAVDATAAMASALGAVWAAGAAIDWDAVHGAGAPRRIALPTYPFERGRYWIDPAAPGAPIAPPARAAAVPAHDAAPTAAPIGFEPYEAAIGQLWRELLGIDRVDASSNFFALGGDSLLATQLMSRIRTQHGVELPLRTIFEAPTPGQLAAVVRGTQRGPAAPAPRPPLVPARRDGALAPSTAQHRLWFLDQFEPGSAVYNVPGAVRITGALDADALDAAMSDLIARHEALRTSFHSDAGRPIQRIAAHVAFALERATLADVPADLRDARGRALAVGFARRPFDLARAPLIRGLVVTLGPAEHLLVVALHHIISDGWSLDVLVRDLAALYRARVAGEPAALPPLTVQPLDAAVWYERWLADGELERQLAYWRRQLGGELPVLALPTDRPHPRQPTAAGGRCTWELPADVVAGLREVTQREGVTLFMALLALYAALLYRLTGQDELCVGSPVATRGDPAIEDLIGFFVSSVVLRVQLGDTTSLRALLGRVRDVTLDAFAHLDAPFERLVEELQPERDPSRTPVFQTMFSLERPSARSVALPGATLAMEPIDVELAMFELSFVVTELPDGLRAALEFSTELFDPATIGRFARRFDVLARAALAEPERPLAALAIIPGDERATLAAWSGAGPGAAWRGGVIEAFRAWVARTPDQPAVEHGARALSYAALGRDVDQLAARLGALGADRDAPVAVYLTRSPELVAALLAVLAAGAAYLPLDPSYPAAQLAWMLADAAPRLVLTTRALRASLPPTTAEIVVVDEPGTWPAARGRARAEPADLAYVMYTSGSTGRPKGVQIPHAALANYAAIAGGHFALTPADRVLQFAALSFDISVEEIFCALTHGATLVLRSDDMLDSIPAFVSACALARISVIDLPTAYWHTLVAQLSSDDAARLACVRLVIIGGEQAQAAAFVRWSGLFGSRVRLLNTYGPTETTVSATIADLTGHAARGSTAAVPIGRPLAGVTARVLDRTGEPTPIGCVGELWVGGVGLARGYLGDAALTAQRFVASARDGERRYRTGDLVRYRADGELVYIGRADRQLKIRGFRVEPGEIEAAIAAIPRVRESVVVAREDVPGDRRLVAYVVLAPGATLAIAELKAALAPRLPDHLQPSAVVVLDRIPTTAGGKLDLRALPAPGASTPPGAAPPRNDLEATLAALFGQALGRPPVGVTDDFFDLGGHSLLATQLLSRINTLLALKLSLRQLFGASTVERLALLIEELMIEELLLDELDPGPAAPPLEEPHG